MSRASRSSGSIGAVPHTGTEMEARPFGTDPETGTGATPEPTLRCTEAGCPELILVPPPFMYFCNHFMAEINEVIGPNAAPPYCPVSPQWDDDPVCISISQMMKKSASGVLARYSLRTISATSPNLSWH